MALVCNKSTVILNSVIGDDILFAQGVCIHFLGLQEPSVHLRAVGPELCLSLPCLLLLLGSIGAQWHERHQASQYI